MVDAAPVTSTLMPPLVVSAVTATVQAAAPASLWVIVTVGVPTITVDAALAPRLIAPLMVQRAVSPAPVTPAITSPEKLYALLLGRVTWLLKLAALLLLARTVAVASVV